MGRLQRLCRRLRDLSRPRRRTALIIDYSELRALARKAQDREEEVVSAARVKPARAKREMPATACGDRALPRELRSPVRIKWIGRVVLDVGFNLGAVENIFGRVVHEECAAPFRLLGEDSGGGGVDRERKLRLALGLVDGRVGGRVDDDVRRYLAYARDDLVGFGEIEAGAVEGDDVPERCQGAFELPADLAVPAAEQNPHANVSASRSRAPATSLAETIGVPTTGHSTARSGSFHATVRSWSGA